MSLATKSRPPEPPCSRLLELPTELLISIARRLSANSHLCQLSLVCRKLKDVAQEALVKEVLLPVSGMRELIRTLCDRPDLCEKISSVDLDDYFCTGYPKDGFTIAEWSHFDQCRNLVGEEAFNNIVRYAKYADGSELLWSKEHQFFLDVLIASCPYLKELSLRLPGSERDQLPVVLGSENGKILHPFSGVSQELLTKQLQVLTLRETDAYKLSNTPNVTISCFSHLARLSIPTDALIYMARKATPVSQALPSSLQHLQLKPCNRYLLLWFPDLATAYLDGLLPKLRRIDFHFLTCLRDSLLLIDHGRGFLQPLRGVIDLLQRSHGIALRGYNGSGTFTGVLLEELNAWSLLSDFERWYPTKKDTEFSSIVARTNEGVPRRRHKEEIRAFIRSDQPSRRPANTRKFVFNPRVDLQNTATLSFFTDVDELPKSEKPKFTSAFTYWLVSVASTQRKSESALSNAPTYLNPKPSAQETTSGTTIPFVFQGKNDCPHPWPTFDPELWHGIQFFESAPPNTTSAPASSKGKNDRKRKHKTVIAIRGCSKIRRVRAKLSDEE